MECLCEGTVLGSYRIIRLLGEGGMGAVYEAEHAQLGVRYALKTYTLEDNHAELFRKRFTVEGRLLARLQHPNLVRVFDLDADEATGILYYAMDLVLYKDGYAHTLTDLEPGGADEDQIYEWFCQLCDALAYVHAQGIVHRDIKLNNILLAPDKRVILSDFGISRVFEDQLRSEVGTTRTIVSSATQGLVVGTHGYMAPEIERGETATPASDVYALGVVFFKLLTGVWYDKDLEPNATSTTRVTNAARLLADFERPWKDVLPAMLATDPARRPTDLTSLPLCLSDQGTAPCEEPTLNGEAMSSSPQNRKNHSSFKKAALWVCALLFAVLSAVLVLFLKSSSADPLDDEALAAEAFAIPESVK